MGATSTKVLIILLMSMPVMKTEMAFMNLMLTQWKDFGLCYVLGYVHIAVFHKRSCLATSLSLSLYTFSVAVARLCFTPYLLFS